MYEAGTIAFELVGDNENVINWLNGTVRCNETDHVGRVSEMMQACYQAWASDMISPRVRHSNWGRHVYREYNNKLMHLQQRA